LGKERKPKPKNSHSSGAKILPRGLIFQG